MQEMMLTMARTPIVGAPQSIEGGAPSPFEPELQRRSVAYRKWTGCWRGFNLLMRQLRQQGSAFMWACCCISFVRMALASWSYSA